MGAPRRYLISTYGCQMNVRDSELVDNQFRDQGMVPAETLDDADIVFVNTCSVRDKAEQKLYSELGRLRKWKSGGPRQIVVGGCVAQQERQRILDRAPYVDLVVGTHQVRETAAHLRSLDSATGESVQVDWKHTDPVARLGLPDRVYSNRPSVFVTIQEGCDNVCTFCIVPFTRGREVSRPPEAILTEVRDHVARGAREIVLLGQNVNSWGAKFDGFPTFAELLEMVNDIDGVDRIRFTSPHPKDYGADVIRAYGTLERLCPSAHLPLQAGSDRVLEAMRRGYTGQKFLEIIEQMRIARPDTHFSTDIIVGFPGETRTDFETTLDIVAEVRFSQIYAFVYSARPGTAAPDLDDPVPLETKKLWLQELFDLQRQIQTEDHSKLVGTRQSVLWTQHSDETLKGRSLQGRVVHAQGPVEAIGRIDDVTVERATANALYGVRAGTPAGDTSKATAVGY